MHRIHRGKQAKSVSLKVATKILTSKRFFNVKESQILPHKVSIVGPIDLINQENFYAASKLRTRA